MKMDRKPVVGDMVAYFGGELCVVKTYEDSETIKVYDKQYNTGFDLEPSEYSLMLRTKDLLNALPDNIVAKNYNHQLHIVKRGELFNFFADLLVKE